MVSVPLRPYWLVIVLLAVPAQAQDVPLQPPSSFLGYELGEQFTPHHRVVDYLEHVADHSPAVDLRRYGTTSEGRPLVLATISTPENHGRLDSIRQSNLQRAGLAEGSPSTDEAVVWLSYNVHGDEPSSTEAALKTLHALADTTNPRTQRWLEDAVVLLDPCLNPDGRERYVQWFRSTVGNTANANPAAREHHAPWAPGRTNHYYFDLNRDWAWAAQAETRQRLDVYHRWMPHVHVDFHEMGIDSPYYFAPAAEPFHEDLTRWQRDFQETIGRNNASYFDRHGWLYFTREVFDLFYPGYGDTWPLFNGAVGMTYEQGGGDAAGRSVVTPEEDTLTLADRIAHHHASGLSTVEVTARHHQQVTDRFASYYESVEEDPPGEYRTYVVRREGQEDRVEALAKQLDRQRIRYGYAMETGSSVGYSYRNGEQHEVRVRSGDLVIDAAQPKGRLVKVLFEPEPTIVDSLMYDITAWSLPYAYGVEGYAFSNALELDVRSSPPVQPDVTGNTNEPYAYLTRWSSRADARFVSALLQEGVRVRFATEEFGVDSRSYTPGTLLITRSGNEDRLDDFHERVQRIAREHDQPLHAVQTGFTDRGPDFGSNSVGLIEGPAVAVLAGAPLSAPRVGEIWHFFEQELEYPVTLLPANDVGATVLNDVDVLVLPDGGYEDWLTDERGEQLTEWVRNGGRLVALGRAVAVLSERSAYALARKQREPPADTARGGEQNLQRYERRQRDRLPAATPGSIHRARLDSSHPLAFGLTSPYFTLKRTDAAYSYLDDGWTVAALESSRPVSGFMGSRAQESIEETFLFGTQTLGAGHVVYFVDNPLFRGFWYSGQVLFSNAVFFVGNH